ncbi:protein POLYCHOME-like [Cornus florida]|uniref:protein POLYCHOME-like n=1 Tax=Cornus florida TaxID=4283 RepID=UPI00289DE214|nr:protein POLYCHOME-like [Cornus florida]
MPESRDRLSRPNNVSAMFALQRRIIGALGILVDEPEMGFETPSGRGTQGSIGLADIRRGAVGRGSFGTPRIGNGRGRSLSRSPSVYCQNTLMVNGRRDRGRSTNSVLPSWYPRAPLGDVTTIVRAIERRRASLREIKGQQIERPIPQDQVVLDPSVSTSGAQLEHDISMISPGPTLGMKCCPVSVGKVSKTLLNIINQDAGESNFLTPQKRLLNSIDTVEKVVMEELRKLKSTPSAEKAGGKKRVRTLMSMR